MSNQENAIYSQNLSLLALKGLITVEFMDGNRLEGEFAAQDALNIFVMVDDTPMMIPRSQIRYLKGSPHQNIEQDDSFAAQPAAAIADGEPTQDIPDLDDTLGLAEDDDFDESEQTMVLPEEGVQTTAESAESPADLFDTDFSESALAEDDEEDFTMVIEQPQNEEDALDEGTFVLPAVDTGADTHEFNAYLDCITGPHAGEVFKLIPGVITIGRSTDNVLPLSKDKEISRKHTKITYEGGQFVAEDQGSLNGTFVNNDRIEGPRYLEDGDVLMVGVSTLIYHKQ
jgi:hypothetical protein